MERNNPFSLSTFVDRSKQNSFFIGWYLDKYAFLNDVNPDQLANTLDCQQSSLEKLALCRMPDLDDKNTRQNVMAISQFVDCNADKLVGLLREVIIFMKLMDPAQQRNERSLMAARDRQGEKEPAKLEGEPSKKQKE